MDGRHHLRCHCMWPRSLYQHAHANSNDCGDKVLHIHQPGFILRSSDRQHLQQCWDARDEHCW